MEKPRPDASRRFPRVVRLVSFRGRAGYVVGYAGASLSLFANMPKSKNRFIVTVIERRGCIPMTVNYPDLDRARLAATGFRGCLAPGMGGEVCILNADGKRIQRWTAVNSDPGAGDAGTAESH